MSAGRTVEALVVERPGSLAVQTVPDAELTDGRFRVDTVYSGLSLGTELTFFRGTNPVLHSGFDPVLGLFDPDRPAQSYPVEKLGYMEVGRVVASRTGVVAEGDLVAMTYGHRTGHTADPLAERFVRLPAGLDPVLGVFVAHAGPICANGLLHAAHDAGGRELADGVRGRDVLVVGAGLVGLLTAVFAQWCGAARVLVTDPTPGRLAAAEALGCETVAGDDVGRLVKERLPHAAGDRGASVVFQCRGSAAALATALRACRPQGTVIDLAFYPGGADEVRLGEEFHHNGLSLRCAQIGRVPRGMAARWDRERLSDETVRMLAARGTELREHLVTDVLPWRAAPALFAAVSAHERHVLAAVLDYTG